MKIALTGGTGAIGSFIAAAALREGHALTLLGRRPPRAGLLPRMPDFRPWTLGAVPDLDGFDAVVHAAFSHRPGRYRGGEGDDPAGFLRDNRDGSIALLRAAARAGVSRAVFLSSRAVFDGYPAGAALTETLPPRPEGLYGSMKVAVEDALHAMADQNFRPVILRATGVYGRAALGLPHKWQPLVAALVEGRPIAPRVSTEVHGDDLAQAVLLALRGARAGTGLLDRFPATPPRAAAGAMIWHASDILLDHRDLAMAVSDITGRTDIPLPARGDTGKVSVLDCAGLRSHGWKPGGWQTLREDIACLLRHPG